MSLFESKVTEGTLLKVEYACFIWPKRFFNCYHPLMAISRRPEDYVPEKHHREDVLSLYISTEYNGVEKVNLYDTNIKNDFIMYVEFMMFNDRLLDIYKHLSGIISHNTHITIDSKKRVIKVKGNDK